MSTVREGSFQRALDKFKAGLSAEQLRSFSICTQDEVLQVVDDIQREHGPKRTLKNMQRIGGFLEAMDHLGKSIEVFLNVHELVCFIWGPIKFMLGIAQTWHNSLDVLLGAYSRIGDEIPSLLQFELNFEKHPTLAVVLEDYFGDILRFHINAMAVFSRPGWKRLFHSTWKTFNSEFDPLLTSLRNRRQLLESVKTSTTVSGIDALRDKIEHLGESSREQVQQAEIARHQDRMKRIKAKIDSPDYEMDRAIATEELVSRTSGQWLLSSPQYINWADTTAAEHRILYINAIPGAGKTTIMTTVVNKLIDQEGAKRPPEQRIPILYFYCKYDQEAKQTFNRILRGLLNQLLDQDQALSESLLEEIQGTDSVKLRTTESLGRLIKQALASHDCAFFFIDGLDECSDAEARNTLDWFLLLTSEKCQGSTAKIKLMFSGQRDGVLDKKLEGHPSISLENSPHLEDVRRYCEGRSVTFRDKFGLDKDTIQEIVSKIANAAQGMFLFAKVVIDNLVSQTRLNKLKQELRDDTFPKGIERAYDRVFLRVFENSNPAEREDAEKVLNWVLCAKRQMRWREIQSIFCIDLEDGDVDYAERRLRVSFKELCGSFVDFHHAISSCSGHSESPEVFLRLVHRTAQTYLIKRGFIDPRSQNVLLAAHCMRYLMTNPFNKGLPDTDIIQHARGGYYGLQDYAVAHWFDHLKPLRVESAALSSNEAANGALKSLGQFLKFYSLASNLRGSEQLDTLPMEDIRLALLSLPEDHLERNAGLDIEYRTHAIRRAIEGSLECNPINLLTDGFINLHGSVDQFKCSKPWCDHFAEGFATRGLRDQHVNRHNLPFRCEFEDCFANKIGFDIAQKLSQHNTRYHWPPEEAISFPTTRHNASVSLKTAVKKGNSEQVKAILEAGGQTITVHPSLMDLAVDQDDAEMLKLLLHHTDYRPYINYNQLLERVVKAGSLDIVNLLLAEEQVVHLGHFLVIAAESGQFEIFQLLFGHFTDSESQQPALDVQWIFLAACRSENLHLCKYIVENLQPDRVAREFAVSVAAEKNNPQLLDLILSVGGLELNFGPAIFKALNNSHHSVARAMFAVANLEWCDSSSLNKILDAACARGLADMVATILVRPGVAVNGIQDRGSPLLAAVGGKHLAVVELLLSSDFPSTPCEVRIRNSKGFTPFLLAMSLWSDEISSRQEQCLALLRRMMRPPIFLPETMLYQDEIKKVLDNSLLLGGDILIELRQAATADPEFVESFWARIVKLGHFGLLEEWLIGSSTRRDRGKKEVLEVAFGFLRRLSREGIDIGKMLRSVTTRHIQDGLGLFIINMALDLGFHDIAALSVLPMMKELAVDVKRELLYKVTSLEKPDRSWPFFQAFVEAGHGKEVLWASLVVWSRSLERTSPGTAKFLLESGLVDSYMNTPLGDCEESFSFMKPPFRILGYRTADLLLTPLLFTLRQDSWQMSPPGPLLPHPGGTLSYHLLINKLAGDSINAVDENGESAIFKVLTPVAHPLLLALLSDERVDVNIHSCRTSKVSALDFAAFCKNLPAVLAILSTGRCNEQVVANAAATAERNGCHDILAAITRYNSYIPVQRLLHGRQSNEMDHGF